MERRPAWGQAARNELNPIATAGPAVAGARLSDIAVNARGLATHRQTPCLFHGGV